MPDELVVIDTRALGHGERHRRHVELHDDPSHLAGIHAYRLLPSELGRVGPPLAAQTGRVASPGSVELVAGEGCAREHLHVDEVEVHRVHISGEVGDLPHLDISHVRRLGDWVHVAEGRGLVETRAGGCRVEREAGQWVPELVRADHLYQPAVLVEELVERQLAQAHSSGRSERRRRDPPPR